MGDNLTQLFIVMSSDTLYMLRFRKVACLFGKKQWETMGPTSPNCSVK